MADNINNTNAPLTPFAVTTPTVILKPSQLINADGTVYFESGRLYKLDASGQPVLVGGINTSNSVSSIGMITPVKGIVYFAASDNQDKQGLYRVDPITGAHSSGRSDRLHRKYKEWD
jgi:hypothetical protein